MFSEMPFSLSSYKYSITLHIGCIEVHWIFQECKRLLHLLSTREYDRSEFRVLRKLSWQWMRTRGWMDSWPDLGISVFPGPILAVESIAWRFHQRLNQFLCCMPEPAEPSSALLTRSLASSSRNLATSSRWKNPNTCSCTPGCRAISTYLPFII